MGIGTLARALRTGLVAILLLFVCPPGFSQDLRPTAGVQNIDSASDGEVLYLSLKDQA
jgi:hypothetical protein